MSGKRYVTYKWYYIRTNQTEGHYKVYGISASTPLAKMFCGQWSIQSKVVRGRLITVDFGLTTHVMMELS
jgi:hypothetical protein